MIKTLIVSRLLHMRQNRHKRWFHLQSKEKWGLHYPVSVFCFLLLFSCIPSILASTTKIWSFKDSANFEVDKISDRKITFGPYNAHLKKVLNWYKSNWNCRAQIKLDNAGNDNALTDFQISLSVPRDSDMRSDFSDLLFTDSDGMTPLDYWMEPLSDSKNAVFWIKIPEVKANSKHIIYMYYGYAGDISNLKNAIKQKDFEQVFIEDDLAYNQNITTHYTYQWRPWTKCSGNPVINTRQFIGEHTNTASVVRLKSSDWRMLFKSQNSGPRIDRRNSTCIRYARSSDGKTWEKANQDRWVLAGLGDGSWEHTDVRKPRLFYDSLTRTYHLYYVGDSPSRHTSPGYASSKDLINWKKSTRNPLLKRSDFSWDVHNIYIEDVIIKDGIWYFFGETNPSSSGKFTIFLSKGTGWEDPTSKALPRIILEPTVLSSGEKEANILQPNVFQIDSTYYMFYATDVKPVNKKGRHIHWAVSTDLETWTKQEKYPEVIEKGRSGTWDAGRVYAPRVLKENKPPYKTLSKVDDHYWLYYSGSDTNIALEDHNTDEAGVAWISSADFFKTYTKNTYSDIFAIWKFDEGHGKTLIDSANSNDAKLVSGTWMRGEGGQWADRRDVSFKASCSLGFLNPNDKALFPPVYHRDIQTVELWAYVVPDRSTRYAFVSSNPQNNRGVYLYKSKNNEIIWDVGGHEIASPVIREAGWYHIAGTLNPINDVQTLYINGQQVKKLTNTIRWGDHTGADNCRVIGGDPNNKNRNWNDKIDEVRIYKRPLNANEILAHFQRRKHSDYKLAYKIQEEKKQYPDDNPGFSLSKKNSLSFAVITDFSEDASKAGGDIRYQLSNNKGQTWYWYNNGWTETSQGYSEANTVESIQPYIKDFPKGEGEFLFRAYLHSNGFQDIQLKSIEISYIEDNTPPEIAMDPPIPKLTNDATPVIIGTAIDDLGEVASVQFRIDSSGVTALEEGWIPCIPKDGAFDGKEESFKIELAEVLTDGKHTIYIQAKDNFGNITDPPYTISFTVDTEPPEDGNIVLNDNNEYTSSREVSLVLTTVGASSTIFSENNDFSGAEWQDYPLTDSTYTLSQGDGRKKVYAKFRDAAGNESKSSCSTTIYLDTVPPAEFIIAPSEITEFTNKSQPQFKWPMTDDTGSGLAYYQVVVEDKVLLDNILPNDPGKESLNSDMEKCISYSENRIQAQSKEKSKSLLEGSYEWKIRAFDKAGNFVESQVLSMNIDQQKPTPFYLIAPDKDVSLNTTHPTFRWTKSSDTGLYNSKTVKYQIFINGPDNFEMTIPDKPDSEDFEKDGKFSVVYGGETIEVCAKPDSITFLEGKYTWKVVAIDAAGNIQENSFGDYKFEIDISIFSKLFNKIVTFKSTLTSQASSGFFILLGILILIIGFLTFIIFKLLRRTT